MNTQRNEQARARSQEFAFTFQGVNTADARRIRAQQAQRKTPVTVARAGFIGRILQALDLA